MITPLQIRTFLPATEVVEHPEFKKLLWNLPPTKKGKIEVAKGRGGPLKIAYEIHGTGPICVVWLIGLGAFKGAWQRQTKDFGHDQASKYSCLIMDNRGMGESDKPFMRYSTSEMAKDAIEVVDAVGWTQQRQLHVVGISMGGMIAQEVGWVENIRGRVNIFLPKVIDAQLAELRYRLFGTDRWLSQPDELGSFPTNGDRFAAQDLRKRMDVEGFTRKGLILQSVAANWHHKSMAQLQEIGDKVGRKRIQVMHGTTDNMITVPHVYTLAEGLNGGQEGKSEGEREEVKVTIMEGRGHVLIMEERTEFGRLVEELFLRTEAMGRDV
ncbi:hypothetical protein MMC25_006169 [Agyrium rufum]|nr:hypothetical protein [Agyrium rufum]